MAQLGYGKEILCSDHGLLPDRGLVAADNHLDIFAHSVGSWIRICEGNNPGFDQIRYYLPRGEEEYLNYMMDGAETDPDIFTNPPNPQSIEATHLLVIAKLYGSDVTRVPLTDLTHVSPALRRVLLQKAAEQERIITDAQFAQDWEWGIFGGHK